MFGMKKKEVDYAEQVEILLGEEAQYEEWRECAAGDICPQLSSYGEYAVCHHMVNGSYAGHNYDYIYEVDVYPSAREKRMSAYHGSIFKLYDAETYQKIYCCTEKPDSLSELKGSGWVEQEKIGNLRVWTEGGRLYEKEIEMLEMYRKWIKDRLCIDYAKEYAVYFDGNSMNVVLFKPNKRSFEWKVDTVNSCLLSLEEKKILMKKGGKLSKENYDFYAEELAKVFFGQSLRFTEISDGATSTLFPILAFFGEIIDYKSVIAKCAEFKFEYMYYLHISASVWDKKIHHWAYTGSCLIIHDVKTTEKLCVSRGACWENIRPFGFVKKQKIGDYYLWKEEERELTQQEISIAKKYYQWMKNSSLWCYQSYYFVMYFDCNDLICIFGERESSTFLLRLENIKKAFHILRIRERKEQEKAVLEGSD